MIGGLAKTGIFLGVVSKKTGELLRFVTLSRADRRSRGRNADKPDPVPVGQALEPSGIAAGAGVWFVGDTEGYRMRRQRGLCLGVTRRSPDRGRGAKLRPPFYVWRPGSPAALCSGLVIYFLAPISEPGGGTGQLRPTFSFVEPAVLLRFVEGL
jgi:hypothetical protein